MWEEVLLEHTHLADLCQRHGDAVELVLASAGDQGLLRGAEAHAENVLFVRLTRVVALWVHRDLAEMRSSISTVTAASVWLKAFGGFQLAYRPLDQGASRSLHRCREGRACHLCEFLTLPYVLHEVTSVQMIGQQQM